MVFEAVTISRLKDRSPMVSSDLGACEWFVWDLRRSGLIDRGQLDQVVGDFLKKSPRAEPPALADFLISQSVLSAFQAERILQGKTQGLVLGPYVLMDAIGSGSMGQVYKATSKTDNQSYAVKVLPRRSMWNVRLARRQVRSFAQFTHPSVVPFVDVGTSGGQHYLVWPLVEGESLEARVEREKRLAPEVAASIMNQVAHGLAVAHQNGLFHGLLKPSNILLGSDGLARILDFGIGSLLAENEGESLVDTMSTANTLTSGLDCSSPESIMEPTNRTQAGDQYSLGCVLYYCLAGRYPFADGNAVEKMMSHQFKQPTPIRDVVPNVPEGLATVIDRLMQKAPESRFAGVDELVDALTPFAADQSRRGSSFAGSHHQNPYATQPSGSRSGGSHFGSRGSAMPIPSSHAGLSSPQTATPPGGLTPIPTSPVSRIPTSNPAVPVARGGQQISRSTFASPAIETPRSVPVANVAPSHYGQDQLPMAQPVDVPQQPALRPGAPRWEEPKQAGGVSIVMIFLIAGLVTAGVYLLGKNFIFPG